MHQEVFRKVIHIASIALPLLVWWVPWQVAAWVLVPAAVAALTIEALRMRFRGPRYLFLRQTRTLLRHRERRGLTGATYMALAYAAALLLFAKPVAVLAMLYNGLGDASAALIGRRWGRHRTRTGKSWEGTGAAFAVCLAAGALIPGIPLLAAAAGAAAAALLELASLPPDDNLWVTLGGGAVVALVMMAV
jgi:dolichol kinase